MADSGLRSTQEGHRTAVFPARYFGDALPTPAWLDQAPGSDETRQMCASGSRPFPGDTHAYPDTTASLHGPIPIANRRLAVRAATPIEPARCAATTSAVICRSIFRPHKPTAYPTEILKLRPNSGGADGRCLPSAWRPGGCHHVGYKILGYPYRSRERRERSRPTKRPWPRMGECPPHVLHQKAPHETSTRSVGLRTDGH